MKIFRIDSSAQQLIAEARAFTGITIVDTAIEEPLARLLTSLNAEAQLSETGAAAMRERLLRVLCNRLRMQRDLHRHPEIRQQQIVRPLIMTGAGRTGSTKLHKMLAAGGDFLYMPFWQGHSLALRSGERGEDSAARVRDADAYIRWFNANAPHARSIHPFGTFEAEEEILILEHGMFGLYMMAFAFVPSFIQWAAQHFREQLEFVKLGLQYLQWQFHDGDARPWVLKCPLYFGAEPLLAEIFPDAVFVATHRNPVSTLSSQTSLVAYYNQAYSAVERKPVLGQMMLEGQAQAMQQFIAGRDAFPQLDTLDIAYTELTQSSLNAVAKIYTHADLPMSSRARQAMAQWEIENAQHKHGVHAHTLAEYGLRTEDVAGKFRPFIERFGKSF